MKLKNNIVLKRILIAFAIVITAALLYVQFLAPNTLEARQRLKLESTQTQLIQAQEKVKASQESDTTKAKQIDDLNKQLKETQDQLQAKRQSQADAAVAAAVPAAPSYKSTGNKDTWLSQSGIPPELWGYVDYIVSRESGWDPCAYNPGQHNCDANPVNACGLVQQNPCHKIPGDWRDPVAALKWQYSYVTGRYGGYPQAVAYWQIHGNY